MNPSDLSNKLRSIASKLDRSKNPSRTLVASELKRLVAAMAMKRGYLTKFDNLNVKPARRRLIAFSVYVNWLNADLNNAVILETSSGGDVAVWCGAGGSPDNYFLQEFPLEVPDADGGDLTAEEAVREAFSM